MTLVQALIYANTRAYRGTMNFIALRTVLQDYNRIFHDFSRFWSIACIPQCTAFTHVSMINAVKRCRVISIANKAKSVTSASKMRGQYNAVGQDSMGVIERVHAVCMPEM